MPSAFRAQASAAAMSTECARLFSPRGFHRVRSAQCWGQSYATNVYGTGVGFTRIVSLQFQSNRISGVLPPGLPAIRAQATSNTFTISLGGNYLTACSHVASLTGAATAALGGAAAVIGFPA